MLVWYGVELISELCLEYVSTTLALRLQNKFYKSARPVLFKPSSYISGFDPQIFPSANKSHQSQILMSLFYCSGSKISLSLGSAFARTERIQRLFMLPRSEGNSMSLS